MLYLTLLWFSREIQEFLLELWEDLRQWKFQVTWRCLVLVGKSWKNIDHKWTKMFWWDVGSSEKYHSSEAYLHNVSSKWGTGGACLFSLNHRDALSGIKVYLILLLWSFWWKVRYHTEALRDLRYRKFLWMSGGGAWHHQTEARRT